MSSISDGRNLEDGLLWRALEHAEDGFPIDATERPTRKESGPVSIQASRSWRWTAPLRAGVRAARRARAAWRRQRWQWSANEDRIDTGGPRLLVDVSALIHGDARSGIQRVIRSMLTALPGQLPAGCELVPVFATSDRPGYNHARRSDSTVGHLSLTPTATKLTPRPGDTFLSLDLAHDVVVAQSGFYSDLQGSGIPVYFVVYDLLPILIPHRFPPGTEGRHHRWLRVVSSADGALCISRSVADELRSWVEANGPARQEPLRISWFHLGGDIERSDPTRGKPRDAARIVRKLAARPTFLLVGTIEPRKGHLQTLAAFERLWGELADTNLAFVGRKGWQMEEFVATLRRHPEAGRRLFWMDNVSDEYLAEIYRASSCLIAASESEGFGLPLIEAAQHGTPIIARDIPVFREIAGDHALYFRGFDPASLANAVRTWLELSSEGQHPRPDGMSWLTWEESAARVVDILFGNQPDRPGASDADDELQPEPTGA